MQGLDGTQVKTVKKAEEKKSSPFFTIGTTQCGLLLAIVGFVFALVLIFLGFWRTMLAALFAWLGFFIGSNKSKRDAVKRIINKVAPPKAD